MVTKREARGRGLRGWNLKCQQCGTYGAHWHPSFVYGSGRYVRLCDDCDRDRRLIYLALRHSEYTIYTQLPKDQHGYD